MKPLRTMLALFGVALVTAAFSPMATADVTWDRRTEVTFKTPVEIPAVHEPGWRVLPPGTYVFKVMKAETSRDVVQIFSKDERTVYATILAIPNYRLKATGKTVFTFRERPAGQPEAMRAWFYPHQEWGHEFVYGKAAATEIARVTKEPVLELPVTVKEEAAKPEEPQVVAELEKAPIKAVEPAGKEMEIAQVVTPPPAEILLAQAAPAAEPTLPKTASPLPLIALSGLLALGGALALRHLAARKS